MESESIKKSTIDEIFRDFAFYQYPEFLKEDYRKLILSKQFKKEKLDEYLSLLSNINYSLKKVLRYEVFFSKFYTSNGEIENFEALNHHIHAYFQDVDTLKNNIVILFDNLRKDLKKVAINKKDIEKFIKAGKDKTYEVFEGVLKYRRQHVHKGSRFIDSDLFKSETSQFILGVIENPQSNQFLNKEKIPEMTEKINKNKIDSFEIAKNRWVNTANKNNPQITGFVNETLRIVKPSLYQFLNIETIEFTTEITKTS